MRSGRKGQNRKSKSDEIKGNSRSFLSRSTTIRISLIGKICRNYLKNLLSNRVRGKILNSVK